MAVQGLKRLLDTGHKPLGKFVVYDLRLTSGSSSVREAIIDNSDLFTLGKDPDGNSAIKLSDAGRAIALRLDEPNQQTYDVELLKALGYYGAAGTPDHGNGSSAPTKRDQTRIEVGLVVAIGAHGETEMSDLARSQRINWAGPMKERLAQSRLLALEQKRNRVLIGLTEEGKKLYAELTGGAAKESGEQGADDDSGSRDRYALLVDLLKLFHGERFKSLSEISVGLATSYWRLTRLLGNAQQVFRLMADKTTVELTLAGIEAAKVAQQIMPGELNAELLKILGYYGRAGTPTQGKGKTGRVNRDRTKIEMDLVVTIGELGEKVTWELLRSRIDSKHAPKILAQSRLLNHWRNGHRLVGLTDEGRTFYQKLTGREPK